MADVYADRADVARLYGRAAFGARQADLDRFTGDPPTRYADIVDSLLAVPEGGTNPASRKLAEEESLTTPLAGQLWWLDRMLSTPYPLEERMTLFWHDHFATALGEVRGDEMMAQNQVLRRNALGSLRTMLYELTVDQAMLRWLDGNLNAYRDFEGWVPNENYARELFELFSLGTYPQPYTETDIREAARALTGWVITGTYGAETVEYRTNNHDKGDKVILGQTVHNLEEEEYKRVVDIALAQPEAPKFIAYKMVQNFAYQPQTEDLFADPDPLVDAVANTLATTDWNLREAMRALLLHETFRSPTSEQRGVRQPIEIAIHGYKAAGIAKIEDTSLVNPLRAAGQFPFEPPNVGGWLLGTSWLTRTGYLGYWWITDKARTLWVLSEPVATLRPPGSDDIAVTGGAGWAAMFGLESLAPTTLDAINAYLNSGDAGNENAKQTSIFLLIANSPQWQVM